MSKKKIEQKQYEFTFLAIEKNGSGSYQESISIASKEDLETAWKEFSKRMDELFGRWSYEISPEEDVPQNVKVWFDELDIEIEEGFSGVF